LQDLQTAIKRLDINFVLLQRCFLVTSKQHYKQTLQDNFLSISTHRFSNGALITANKSKIVFRSRMADMLTLSPLMSYICGAPCKARNFKVLYIWTYVWQRWKPSFSIRCTMFQHWINAESYPAAQLCVNTLLATKVTLITDGI
jgi:hypothetical protein